MAFRKLKLAAILIVAILLGVFLLSAFAIEDEDILLEDIGTLHVRFYVLYQDGTQEVLVRSFKFSDLLAVIEEKVIDSFWYRGSFTPAHDMRLFGYPDTDATTLTMDVLSGETVVITKQIQQPATVDATAGVTTDLLTGGIADYELSGLPDGDYTLVFTLRIGLEIVGETGIRVYTVEWPRIAFRMESPPEDPPNGGGDPPRPLSPRLLPGEPIVTRVL